MWCFKDTNQMSELDVYEFKLPKYPESTTDPTYYEPQATRISNMRKSATAMKSIYDFEGEEAKSFVANGKDDELRVLNKIKNVNVDPRFNNTLTREEVSQVVNELSDQAQNIVESKKDDKRKLKDAINETVTVQKVLENTKQSSSTNEE